MNLLSGHRRSRTASANPVTQLHRGAGKRCVTTSCVSGRKETCSVSSFWFPGWRCVSAVMGTAWAGRGRRRDSLDLRRRQADFLLVLSVRAGLLQREGVDLKVTTQLSHLRTDRVKKTDAKQMNGERHPKKDIQTKRSISGQEIK